MMNGPMSDANLTSDSPSGTPLLSTSSTSADGSADASSQRSVLSRNTSLDLDDVIKEFKSSKKDKEYADMIARNDRQEIIGYFYDHDYTQIAVTGFIVGSCMLTIVSAEISGDVPYQEELDTGFLIVFLVDVSWNFIGHFGTSFFTGIHAYWNIFDFVIVLAGVVVKLGSFNGGTMIRTVRILRILKLFGRSKQYHKTIYCIINAVLSSGLILLLATLVIAMYALLGHELFKDSDFYDEQWSTFTKAFYTLFQCMTFESWSSGVARATVYDNELDWITQQLMQWYWFTFIVFVGIIVINVLIVVFFEAYTNMNEQFSAIESKEDLSIITEFIDHNPNDPMIQLDHAFEFLRENKRDYAELLDLLQSADKFDEGVISYEALYYTYLEKSESTNSSTNQIRFGTARQHAHMLREMSQEFTNLRLHLEELKANVTNIKKMSLELRGDGTGAEMDSHRTESNESF